MPREQRAIVKIGAAHRTTCRRLEGSIDSAHSWFLHRGIVARLAEARSRSRPTPRRGSKPRTRRTGSATPRSASRNEDPEHHEVRARDALRRAVHRVHPAAARPKREPRTSRSSSRSTTRTRCSTASSSARTAAPVDARRNAREQLHVAPGRRPRPQLDPSRRRENRWNQDRAAMKNGELHRDQRLPEPGHGRVRSRWARRRPHARAPRAPPTSRSSGCAAACSRMSKASSPAGQPIGLDPAIPYDRLRAEQQLVPVGEAWQLVGGR